MSKDSTNEPDENKETILARVLLKPFESFNPIFYVSPHLDLARAIRREIFQSSLGLARFCELSSFLQMSVGLNLAECEENQRFS